VKRNESEKQEYEASKLEGERKRDIGNSRPRIALSQSHMLKNAIVDSFSSILLRSPRKRVKVEPTNIGTTSRSMGKMGSLYFCL